MLIFLLVFHQILYTLYPVPEALALLLYVFEKITMPLPFKTNPTRYLSLHCVNQRQVQ